MKKLATIFLSFLFLLIGGVGGFYVLNYFTLPETEEVTVTEEIYYSNTHQEVEAVDVSSYEFSVHFLELGNKYTGDCTYIKTAEADILIDCGSKSNSIETVANYLENYVTDGKLEYVIVTHAHQDHYAGFATTTKVDSIFDKFECETIIDFAQTNQKETSTMYQNYCRELADEIAQGAKHYTALDCINGTNGGQRIFEIGNGISMEILDSYYYSNKSSSENDYSVCVLFSQGEKHFIFTGDLEAQGEAKLIEMNTLPKVELYKAGHHGSKTSSTVEFLEVIQPKTVCVCCCAGSSEYTKSPENQFPTQIFINNVAKWTQQIYVTTLCIDYANDLYTSFNGNIVYLSNPSSYTVSCSNNNTILRESEWFKQNRKWP
ncbi:MAG: ComEC/Rec2 family competence protein [Candidatus Caccovivens sp.]